LPDSKDSYKKIQEWKKEGRSVLHKLAKWGMPL